MGKKANIAPTLLDANRFTLSFLSQKQEALSSFFAGIWKDGEPPPPFEFLDWEGGPLLKGSVAGVGLRHREIYEGGDHWIVVGEVTTLHRPADPGKPLIFYNGLYRQLKELEDEYGNK